MNSKQIDDAMRNRSPVIYEGTRFERIREYISWYDTSGKHQLSVVVQNGNYCQRVLAEKVRLLEENNEQ